MANPRISQVQLPNGDYYDIYDALAVHNLQDLNLDSYLKFKGVVANIAALNAITDAAVGDVYHVGDVDSEYIWVGGDDPHWEEFGSKFAVDHTHNIPELSGSIQNDGSAAGQVWTQTNGTISGTVAAQTWTQGTGTISGTAAAQTWTQSSTGNSVTVTGSNGPSGVTGSGTVAVPTVTENAKYAKVSTGADTFVKSYPGATSKMITKQVTPAGTATAVVNSVTPTTGSVTGVSGSTTASKATAGSAVNVAKAGTAVDIPNVTGNTSVKASKVKTAGSSGTATAVSSWSATVTGEILSFNAPTANYVNSVTMPTFDEVTATNTSLGDDISVVPAVDNGSITPYTFSNVTVPKAATAATTVVTGVTSGTTNVATVGEAVTVATGSLASNGGGSAVMTGLGTASTGSALTSATLEAATSATGIHTGDDVTIGSTNNTVNITGTAEAQEWTQGTGNVVIKGTNAESKISGSVTVTGTNAESSIISGSATVTGTNAASKVTGSVKVGPGTTGQVQ